MSAYGTPWLNTPAFDRVAGEGILFNNAYTCNAKSAPSRAAIITGRNSWQLKEACNHWPNFPVEFKSYPEALAENGYYVGCTGKGWGPGVANDAHGRKREITGKGWNKRKLEPPTANISKIDYAANFEDFMKDRPKDRPFCFWYGALEPHRSYEYGSSVRAGKRTEQIDAVPEYWPDNELGLQVGPGFFSSFRKGGVQLNMLALGVVLIGTLMTVLGSYGLNISLPDMVGILCGATTNTPALGAAQQTLKQMGLESSTPALGCAVAYPLGVVGVILAVLAIRKALVRKEDLELKEKDDANKTYIAAFQVHNPAIFNKSIKEIGGLNYPKFVISRLWRDGNVSIPTSEKIIKEGDRLLVVTSEKYAPALTVLFGEQEHTDWNKEDIDWNAIDSQLISQRIVVTRPELNGKKLGSLHLRNHYGINISRVYRSGVQLLATAELTLQLGDRLTVVGEAAAIQNVEKVLGNAIKSLKEPNLVAVFIGIVLGLALGAIPFSLPGISAPVKLGLAGGPIIVGILIGTFGPRMHMVTYTTRSANLMLRALGLSLYLACLGLDAGAHFFETVFRPEGLLWIAAGFVLTVVPVLIMGVIAFKGNL